jgi:hypothetical protein
MPRCSVCDHANRKQIDLKLAANATPLRRLAADENVSESAMRRHRANHLPAKLARSAEAKRVAESEDLGEQVRALRAKAIDLLQQAEIDGDTRTALAAIRETRGLLELMAKVQGPIDDGQRVTVAVQIDTGWPVVRSAVLETLANYPAGLLAVSERLAALEQSS